MNYKVIPEKWECLKCGNVSHAGSSRCIKCDTDFTELSRDFFDGINMKDVIFSQPSKCLWDGVPPGQPMGMICTCPKCAVYATSNTTTLKDVMHG